MLSSVDQYKNTLVLPSLAAVDLVAAAVLIVLSLVFIFLS